MSTRKVVFALAGTATGALLLIGAKGARERHVGRPHHRRRPIGGRVLGPSAVGVTCYR